MASKSVRLDTEVIAELEKIYPQLTPNQALRKELSLPEHKYTSRRKHNRFVRALRILFGR